MKLLGERQEKMKAELLEARSVAKRKKRPKKGVCAVRKIKSYTIDDMRQIAAERGGECLEDTYINGEVMMRWVCRLGHVFAMAAKTILRGHWCRICGREQSSRVRKFPLAEVRGMIRKMGCDLVDVPDGYKNKYSRILIKSLDGSCECECSIRSVRYGSKCNVWAERLEAEQK